MPPRLWLAKDDWQAIEGTLFERDARKLEADAFEREAQQIVASTPPPSIEQSLSRIGGWTAPEPPAEAPPAVPEQTPTPTPFPTTPAARPTPTPSAMPSSTPTPLPGARPVPQVASTPQAMVASSARANPQATPQEVEGYIRQAAQRRGIDPETAVRVANSEGGTDPARRGTFATGSSWWPFQLHYGGKGYEHLGSTAGMGNSFTAETGIQPGDPSGWQAATDYALERVKQAGWGAWYGAQKLGITGFMGVDKNAPDQPSPSNPLAAAARGLGLVPNQFGDPALSAAEAAAACGPAAAVAFARANGRNPTLKEALEAAKQVGWTAGGGMNGIGNQKRLLDSLGIPSTMDTSGDWGKISQAAQSGQPVAISTPAHYWVADAYDPATGRFHVGASGTAFKAGKEWMTQAEITALGRGVNGALFSDARLSNELAAADFEQEAAAITGRPPPVNVDPFAWIGDMKAKVAEAGRGFFDNLGQANPLGALSQVGASLGGIGSAVEPSPVPAPGFGYDPSNMRPGVAPAEGVPLDQDVRDLSQAPQPTIFQDPTLIPGIFRGPLLTSDKELLERTDPMQLDAARRQARMVAGIAGLEPTESEVIDVLRAQQLGQAAAGERTGRMPGAATAREVRPSNPFELPTTPPSPESTPLATPAITGYLDELGARYSHNDVRIEQITNTLDGLKSGGGVKRPPWAAGMADEGIIAVARRFDLNPYQETWWSAENLYSRTDGEMEDLLSYYRNLGTKALKEQSNTPTALKAELADLKREQGQLMAAADQLDASPDATYYRPPQLETGDLPWGSTGVDVPPQAVDTGVRAGPTGTVAREGAPAAAGDGGRYAADAPAGRGAGIAPPAATAGRLPALEPRPGAASGLTPAGQGTLPGTPSAPATRIAPPPTPPRPPAGQQLPLGSGPNGDRALATLDNMYGRVTTAPMAAIPGAIEQARRGFVRKWTDRGIDLAEYQKDAERVAGRPLNADEMAYEMRRLNPSGAANDRIQNQLKPAIQSVGEDVGMLRSYLTLRDNVDVAKALDNPNRAFSGGLTAADSEAGLARMAERLGPERMAKVEASADQIVDYGRQLLQRKLDAGLIPRALYDDLTTKYPNYSPTRIVDYLKDSDGIVSGRKISVQSAGLKRNTLEGTTRQREDPLASFVRLAHETEALATKNEVAQAVVKLRNLNPDAKLMIREVADDTPNPHGFDKMKVFTDGVPQTYQMPSYMARAIKEEPIAPVPFMGPLMNMFRMLATQRNPTFLASNALVDAITSTLRSSSRLGGPQHAPRVALELFKAYGDAFQGLLKGEYRGDTARYMREGGAMSGFFSRDPGDAKKVADALQRSNALEIRSAHAGEDIKRLIGQALKLKPVEAIGERIELAPRVAAMRLAERAGQTTQDAVIAGRTVTIDFSQGGTWGKVLNQWIPFFNVATQSAAALPRAFRENPRGFIANAVGLLAAPTVGIEAWNRSDAQRAKDYEDVPSYVKDAGLVFMLPTAPQADEKGNRKPQYLFFPLREYAPFAVLTREAAGRAMGAEPSGWGDMLMGVGQSSSPVRGTNIEDLAATGVPLGVSTALQLATDRDWFRGGKIVSQRGDEQASALSGVIASALQKIGFESRPSAVEFATRDMGAGVGGTVMAGSDMLAGKPRKDERVQSTPGVGGLVGRFLQDRTGERLTKAIDQPVPAALERELKDAGLGMPTVPNEISVRNSLTGNMSPPIALRQAERAEYQRIMAERLAERLRPMLSAPTWEKRPIESRNKILESQVRAAREYAESRVFASMAQEDRSARMQAGRAAAAVKPRP